MNPLTLRGRDDSTVIRSNEELIAAQTGKRIAVYKVFVSAKQATKIIFESAGAPISSQYVAAGGGQVRNFDGQYHFITGSNEALTYTTDTSGGCTVEVVAAVV